MNPSEHSREQRDGTHDLLHKWGLLSWEEAAAKRSRRAVEWKRKKRQ